MEREDLVGNFGLRLGPAVKLFNRIKKLQDKLLFVNQLWKEASVQPIDI